MLQASQLRNGTIFVYNGEPFEVLSYKHTHMSRRGADVRVKIRGLVFGKILSENFAPDERFEEAELTKREMQFLYKEGKSLVFMDPKTFEQAEINTEIVGQGANFLIEGEVFPIRFWQEAEGEERAIDIELPPSVALEVIDCPPGVRGNSATNVYKPATLSNGITTKVPLFINQGEKVRIDTRTGEYVERAK